MGTSKIIIAGKINDNLFLKIKHRLKKPEFSMRRAVLESMLQEEELAAFRHVPQIVLDKKDVEVFYPGCGLDLVQPLVYASKMMRNARSITFILADKDITAGDVVSLMLQLTGNHNYRLGKIDERTESASFQFKDKQMRFICKRGDVLSHLPREISKGYDVYFERAFEIFRNEQPAFIYDALHLLRRGGIVITDAGLNKALTRDMEQIAVLPEAKALGFYKNLSMYRKN